MRKKGGEEGEGVVGVGHRTMLLPLQGNVVVCPRHCLYLSLPFSLSSSLCFRGSVSAAQRRVLVNGNRGLSSVWASALLMNNADLLVATLWRSCSY